MDSVYDYFKKQVERQPDDMTVFNDSLGFTFRELDVMAHRIQFRESCVL